MAGTCRKGPCNEGQYTHMPLQNTRPSPTERTSRPGRARTGSPDDRVKRHLLQDPAHGQG